MKAIVVDKYQKNGALRLADVPEPTLQDDDVLVQIHATAVNLLDSKLRNGDFKAFLPYKPPFILGHDLAGTVLRVATKVTAFKVGEPDLGAGRVPAVGRPDRLAGTRGCRQAKARTKITRRVVDAAEPYNSQSAADT